MDFETLILAGGFALVIGVVLLAVGLLASGYFLRRHPSSNRIRVTRIGIWFGVAQTILIFAIVGWGFFQPETFLGSVVAHGTGVPAIIILVSAVGCVISFALQRQGIVLYYRSQGGG